MSKRLAPLAALLLLLALPAVVLAGVILIPITEFQPVDFGQTTTNQPSPDRLGLTTTGLQGTATVCATPTECGEMQIGQDLQILIDFTSAGVRARTQGEIFFPPLGIDVWEHAYFRGSGRGDVACVGQGADPCDQFEVTLRLRSSLRDAATGEAAGQFRTEIVARTTPDCNTTCAWEDVTMVSGVIRARTP